MIYDICVVGAGLFGSAAAKYASSCPSLKVCLVGASEPTAEERKDREIFSSHYDEGRVTRVLDEDTACQVLSRHSIRKYKEIEKLSGIKFHTPVGCLHIIKKNGDLHRKLLLAIEANTVATVDVSRKETFEKRYPYLQYESDKVAILDDNGGGHISPRKLGAAQKKIAQLQGCDLYETIVEDIKLENGLYKVENETHKTIVQAKRLIIATGAFTNYKKFSVLNPLKLTKRKETVAMFEVPENEVNRLSSLPDTIYEGECDGLTEDLFSYFLSPIEYPDGKFYMKVGIDGWSNEAKTLEDVKQWYLSKGDQKLIDLETKLLKQIIPNLKYNNITSLTCVNCLTPSALPYIDRITPTLTVAIAGNGKGAKFSDEVGRIAAQLCMTGNWDSELAKDRFEAVFA